MVSRRKFSTLRGTESGQAMVEFVLVVLFIFLLFVSILQFILLMYAYTTVANSAKEGVRYAVVHGTGIGAGFCSGPGTPPSVQPAVSCSDSNGTKVQNTVKNLASLSFQNVSNVTVDYDPNGANSNSFGGACSAPGCLVRVTVSHAYTPLFLSWLNVTLNAAANGSVMN